jgi:hypothetical protein
MPDTPEPAQEKNTSDFASQIRGAEDVISHVKEAEIRTEARRTAPVNWKVLGYAAVILASLVTVYLNIPELMAATLLKKPLRAGTYLTDRKTDLCICNLWAITASMRAKEPLPALTCPASGKPYIVERDLVRCPSPDLHAASKLYADAKNVIPFHEK